MGERGSCAGGGAGCPPDAAIVITLPPPTTKQQQGPHLPPQQQQQQQHPPPPPPSTAQGGRRQLFTNSALVRALAAACLSSFATGWVMGVWGGVSAMPAFAAAFFPESVAARRGGGGGAAHYCMFDDQLLSLGGSVIYLAALPALAVAARATHAFGRLPTMWAIAGLLAASAAIGAAAPTTRAGLGAVFVGRALAGGAMGCSFQAPTMLLSEVLPRHLRGQGLFTHTLAMLLGFLLSAVANQALHPHAWGWRAGSALLAVPAAALFALLPFVSESPQALCQRGDAEGARAALAAARPPGTDISQELAQIAAAAAAAPAARPAAASAGAGPQPAGAAARRRRQLLGNYPVVTASVLYPLTLMLTGLSAFSGWTPNLLLAMGASSRLAYGGNTLMMAVGLAAAAIATVFVDRVNRRTLLAAGGFVIVATLAALAALLAAFLPGTEAASPPPAALLPLVVLLMCVNRAALSCTIQPLTVTVPAEVQPLSVRSQASALTTATRNGASFLFAQFALPLLCATRWGLFAILAAATAAGVTALWLLVPETRGLALEEVHLAWGHHWLWGRWEDDNDDEEAQQEQQQQQGREVLPVTVAAADLAALGPAVELPPQPDP